MSLNGKRIYVITAPEDVALVYRNSTSLSFNFVVEDMHRWIGLTPHGFEAMFLVDESAKHNEGMAHALGPTAMIVEYHRMQNKPGGRLDDFLRESVVPSVDKCLHNLAKTVRDGNNKSQSNDDRFRISLLELCTQIFVHGTTTVFFGDKIWDVNPSFVESFELWERTNWKFMFQMPDFMSKDMVKAKDALIATFAGYLSIPTSERGDMCWFVKSVEGMLRDVGLEVGDMAKILMLHHWA